MKVEPTTVQPITSLFHGPNTLSYCSMMALTASATTLSATTTDLKTLSFAPALSNPIRRGDFIGLSGAYAGYYLPVLSGTTSTCVLAVDLPANLNSGTTIYPVRPIPLSAGTAGGISTNIAEWGGVATSLGQKAEASSVPVVLATEQAFTVSTVEPDYTDPGLYARNIPSRPVQSSDTITSVADTAQLLVVNYSHLVFSISGTYSNISLVFEASIDNATTWGYVQARRVDATIVESASSSLTNTTRHWKVSVDAFTHFRVRATAYTSGTGNIKFSASYQPHDPIVAADYVQVSNAVSVVLDGIPTIQQDTLTSFYYGLPVLAWDNSAGQFAAIPLSNGGTTVPTEILNVVEVVPTLATVANVARGKIAAASLTGSYATLLTMGGTARVLHLYNSTDQPVLISLDGGTTDSVELDAGECRVVDYYANGLSLTSATIQAKYVSTAPSVGSVRADITRV